MINKVSIFPLSQFKEFDSAYWGLGCAKNGMIYFALCTHLPQHNASIFSFNPQNNEIKEIFNMSTIIKTKSGFLSQGKIHTPLFEGSNKQIYFATHFAYPFGKPQKIKYEGGHWVSFDPKTHIASDLGIGVCGEGIITMTMDNKRMLLYGLTAPSFNFIAFDVSGKKSYNFGRVCKRGSICRSLVIDNRGDVYGSFEQNRIFRFNRSKFSIEILKTRLPDSNQRISEWKGKYRKGVNFVGRKIWRTAIWDKVTEKIYGIHAGSHRLFELDTQTLIINEKAYMCPKKFKNRINEIYPTLSLVKYHNLMLYCPAGGFFDYGRSEKIQDKTHLISYNISNQKKEDHGEISNNSSRVIGIAGATCDNKGVLYLLGAVDCQVNLALIQIKL